MIPATGDLAAVIRAVLRDVQKLSDDQLRQLVAGEGTLRFVPRGSAVTREAAAHAPVLPATVAEVRSRLRAAGSEAEARTYLRGLGLKLDQLRWLAGQLEVRPVTTTSSGILSDIVKVYVSGRVLTKAVQRT